MDEFLTYAQALTRDRDNDGQVDTLGKEKTVGCKLSVSDIEALGFAWPKHALIEQHSVTEHGQVDLVKTLHELQSSRAFYQQQISQAFAFKQQTGADYADFTDRHDDNVQMKHRLEQAIAYLESILEASKAARGGETDG